MERGTIVDELSNEMTANENVIAADLMIRGVSHAAHFLRIHITTLPPDPDSAAIVKWNG